MTKTDYTGLERRALAYLLSEQPPVQLWHSTLDDVGNSVRTNPIFLSTYDGVIWRKRVIHKVLSHAETTVTLRGQLLTSTARGALVWWLSQAFDLSPENLRWLLMSYMQLPYLREILRSTRFKTQTYPGRYITEVADILLESRVSIARQVSAF